MHVVSDTQRDLTGPRATVILGVAASDAHAVANHLIAYSLRGAGFEVINLGTCTPVTEFAQACAARPDADVVVIGSLNGHARHDLHDLPAARAAGRIPCPVVVGGNLSVGSHKDGSEIDRLYALGVDRVAADPAELPALIDALAAGYRRRRAAVAEPVHGAGAAALLSGVS